MSAADSLGVSRLASLQICKCDNQHKFSMSGDLHDASFCPSNSNGMHTFFLGLHALAFHLAAKTMPEV
jgi:hypothetical protein